MRRKGRCSICLSHCQALFFPATQVLSDDGLHQDCDAACKPEARPSLTWAENLRAPVTGSTARNRHQSSTLMSASWFFLTLVNSHPYRDSRDMERLYSRAWLRESPPSPHYKTPGCSTCRRALESSAQIHTALPCSGDAPPPFLVNDLGSHQKLPRWLFVPEDAGMILQSSFPSENCDFRKCHPISGFILN